MIVDRHEINAGQMLFGTSATFNVPIKNNYPESVKITAVQKSCTCTTASLEGPSDLPPGGQSMVKITITPGSTGAFSRRVLVKFNRPPHGEFTDTIELKAMVHT